MLVQNVKSLNGALILASLVLTALVIFMRSVDRAPKASQKQAESSLLSPETASGHPKRKAAPPPLVAAQPTPASKSLSVPSLIEQSADLVAMARRLRAEQGGETRARLYLEKALTLNPGDKLAMEYYLRSFEGGEKADVERGLKFLEELEASVSDVNLSLDIGTLLLKLERPDEAVAMIESGLTAELDAGYEHWNVLAQAYLAAGRIEEAARVYETITKSSYAPSDTHFARLQLAKILLELGRETEALEELRALQELDPAYRDISSDLIAQLSTDDGRAAGTGLPTK